MKPIALLLACFVVLFSYESRAQDGLPKAAGPLIEAIKGITDAANTGLKNSRNSVRATYLRKVVYQNIATLSNADWKLIKADPDKLLCDAQADYAAAIAQRAFLLQVSGAVDKTAKIEIDGLISALKSFFEDVNIDPATPVSSADIRQKATAKCKADLVTSAQIYVGSVDAPRAGTIEAAISLYQLIADIFKNAVVGTATAVAAERRKEVIRKYLATPAMATNVQNAAKSVLSELRHTVALDRANAAGTYRSALARFDTALAAALADDKAKRACDQMSVGKDGFWTCWNVVWTKDIQAAAKDVLEGTSMYDGFGDIGVATDERAARALRKAFDDIRNPQPVTFEDLLALGGQLFGLAKEYEKAFSKENRDKIKSAVDTLVNAF